MSAGGEGGAGGVEVCMLTTGFPRYRGDLFGSFIFDLALGLVRRGHRVQIITPHARDLPTRELVDGVSVRRFRYAVPSGLQRLAYGGGIPSNLKSSLWARVLVPVFLAAFVLRALQAVRGCQVVHCHWTICGLIGYLATRLWRRPVVLSVRGSDVHVFSDGLMGRFSRRIWRWMDQIIAVSEDLAKQLEERGIPRSKIRVVYNGVDDEFKPRDRDHCRSNLGLPSPRFIALFVGLLAHVKGIEILLQAVETVEDADLLCVLVGDGPLRERLEQQAGDKVLFVGQRPREEIADWLNAADVLVLPSFSEGRPNVVLEAMACAKPVIASRVGGVPELVEEGVTGRLIAAGSSAELAAALRDLMADRSALKEMGRAARSRVENAGWTWDASAQTTAQIYAELARV